LEFGIPYEDLTLDTPDGLKIKAYLMKARSKSALMRLKGMKAEEVQLEGDKSDGSFVSLRIGFLYYIRMNNHPAPPHRY
jgi:hypothetical protein